MRLDSVWSAKEDELLRELFAQGMKDGEIGRRMGRPEGGIKARRLWLRLIRHKRVNLEVVDAMKDYYPPWFKEQLRKECRGAH